jgi:hypothetical protein
VRASPVPRFGCGGVHRSMDSTAAARPGHSGHRGPRLPVPAQHTSWHWQLSSAYIAIIRFRWSSTCGRRIHGLEREIDGLPPADGPAPAGWPFLALLADQYQHHAVTVTTYIRDSEILHLPAESPRLATSKQACMQHGFDLNLSELKY